MKTFLLAGFLLGSLSASSQVLRLSEVVKVASDDAVQMTAKGTDRNGQSWEEQLFVRKAAIVTEKDVEKASPIMQGPDSMISVELSAEGGERMKAATTKMEAGVDRIAIIIDGEILNAPIVQSVPLGNQFVVGVGKESDWNKANDLARRISGQPPSEPSDEDHSRPTPTFEYEAYTEDEYLQRKADR